MLMADDAYSSGPTASALQTWTLLHLSLVLLALLLYAAHLRGAFSAAGVGGRGPSRLLTWVPPSTAGLVASCTPCASRQAQKLVCLAALAFGSPVAASHLEWSNALDLALLVAQYAVQEWYGGAPVDDVALALPLDLCASFVLLGVAQNRIHMQFSWVVANLVMSFSVSTIPLVFGHKLPRGTPGAGSMPQLEQEGPPDGLSRNSSHERSTLNGNSTVTDSSDFNSRRSSLHMPVGHLTAAQLDSFVQSQGGYSRPCRSQCGSSTSSVVEQLQGRNTPRVTAKPLHRLDRVTLPSDADAQQDPTSTLIMRSSGMAIEMLDKHGRSMHYTSRVRRQRVYIKTGVGGIRDARLQQLLPRVQHSLLAAQAQSVQQDSCGGAQSPGCSSCSTSNAQGGAGGSSVEGSSPERQPGGYQQPRAVAGLPEVRPQPSVPQASARAQEPGQCSLRQVHLAAVQQHQRRLQGGTSQVRQPSVPQAPPVLPPSLCAPPLQRQPPGAAGQRPVFGGVYMRDGCVEMTLDLLSFEPSDRASVPTSLEAQGAAEPPCMEGATPCYTPICPPACPGTAPAGAVQRCSSDGDMRGSWSDPPGGPPAAEAALQRLPLAGLGPSSWLELMGLSHTLQRVRAADLTQPCSRPGGTAPSSSASRDSGAVGTHFDPYVKVQLCEHAEVREWRLHSQGPPRPAEAHLPCCTESPTSRTQQQQGRGGLLKAEAARTEGQQWQPALWAPEHGGHAGGQTHLAPSAACLVGAHPLVVVAGGTGCSTSTGSAAPLCSSCMHLHVYVLLPGGTCTGGGSLPVSVRHRGRFLPVRVLSSSANHVGKDGARARLLSSSSRAGGEGRWSGAQPWLPAPTGEDAAACSAVPVLLVMEVEVVAALHPGLVHVEVCDPSMGAPTASACVLVVALEQELMARELQQLQPSCEAQAQQEASAHAWELLQQWGRSEPARQDLGMEMDAPPGRRTAVQPPGLSLQSGARAVLHDLGVWLELEGARTAASPPSTATLQQQQQQLLRYQPCCTAGSADLSTQFVQGLACTHAAEAEGVDDLALHLADVARSQGWAHTVRALLGTQPGRQVLQGPSCTTAHPPAHCNAPSASPSTGCCAGVAACELQQAGGALARPCPEMRTPTSAAAELVPGPCHEDKVVAAPERPLGHPTCGPGASPACSVNVPEHHQPLAPAAAKRAAGVVSVGSRPKLLPLLASTKAAWQLGSSCGRGGRPVLGVGLMMAHVSMACRDCCICSV